MTNDLSDLDGAEGNLQPAQGRELVIVDPGHVTIMPPSWPRHRAAALAGRHPGQHLHLHALRPRGERAPRGRDRDRASPWLGPGADDRLSGWSVRQGGPWGTDQPIQADYHGGAAPEKRTFGERPGTRRSQRPEGVRASDVNGPGVLPAWRPAAALNRLHPVAGSATRVFRYVLGVAELILPAAALVGDQAPPR